MKKLQKISNYYSHIILFLLFVTISFLSVKNFNIHYDHHSEKINKTGKNIWIECKINSYPQLKEDYVQAKAEVTKSSVAELEGLFFLLRSEHSLKEFKMGDTLRAKGKLSFPQGASNPGSFDYKEYLKSQNIVAIFKADPKSLEIIDHPPLILQKIYLARDSFIQRADSVLPADTSALLRAVVGGDRSDISLEDSLSFKKSGIYHIVAISGLHLNIFICAVYSAIRRLGIKRKYKAVLSVISCLAIGLFVLIFTGFGVSLMRAFLMSLILSVSTLIPRHYNSKTALFATGFIIIILYPYNFYSTAFRLSFLSTLGVLVAIDFIRMLKRENILPILHGNYVGNTFVISLTTSLFTLVVSVSAFGFVPLFSWLANLLILPVMPYILGLGAVFASVAGFAPEFLLKLLGYGLVALWKYVSLVSGFISELSFATADIRPIFVLYFFIAFFLFATGTYIFFRHSKKSALALILIFAVAGGSFLLYNNHNDNAELIFADVGQGDCAILSTNDCCIMMDCGTSSDVNYMQESVEATLRSRNIKKIDVVIVSHFHSDHTNLLHDLLKEGKVEKLVLPAYYDSTEPEAAENKNMLICNALYGDVETVYVKSGDRIECGKDLSVKFLSPDKDMFFDANNMSLVSELSYGKNKILFCGDADCEGIAKCVHEISGCHIIKLPHHGSYTNMSEDLISRVGADYGIISCSRFNNYNHPDKRVLKLLSTHQCKAYCTDETGAVIVSMNKEKITHIETMR